MKTSFALTLSLLSCLVLVRSAAAQAPATTTPPPASTPPSLVQVGGSAPLRNQGITGWGILHWGGIGVGGRYMLPLGIQPLLVGTQVRDSFALEFGADFLHISYGYLAGYDYSWNLLLPVVGIMWNIAINDQIVLYPKFEAGYYVGLSSSFDNSRGIRPGAPGIFFDFTGGILYKLTNGLSLRAEAGYAGLKAGVGWIF